MERASQQIGFYLSVAVAYTAPGTRRQICRTSSTDTRHRPVTGGLSPKKSL
ncbi:hypothetical protein D083_4129 [Dickeya solani RNS 08.23.3.1.A]|nr:hypothetical protein D083_4129 [Dickeya solani RNS 08.23.3.1.A]